MRIKTSLILLFIITISAVIVSCMGEPDNESNPCMCFQNASNSSVSGIRYRVSGTTVWIPVYFEETVYSGDAFDCSEGKMDRKIDEGTYDFQIIGSNSQTWEFVPYDGGNIGITIEETLSNCLYGSVDGNCSPDGSIYTADY